jgi:hypothetical protein
MSDNFNLKKFLTENKLTTNARVLEEVAEDKSVDQLMTDLGDAILADNSEAMKIAFKNLKTGLIGRIKNKAEDLKGHLEKKYTEESLNEGGNRERQVYDIVEDSVDRALSAIEQYKNTADTDQSGDLGIFHDVEVALEDVLDFLIYTQKPDVD